MESTLNQAKRAPQTPRSCCPHPAVQPILPSCQDLQSAVQAHLSFPGSIYEANIDLINPRNKRERKTRCRMLQHKILSLSFCSPGPGDSSQAGASLIAAGFESSSLSSRGCHMLSSDLVSFSSCSTYSRPHRCANYHKAICRNAGRGGRCSQGFVGEGGNWGSRSSA